MGIGLVGAGGAVALAGARLLLPGTFTVWVAGLVRTSSAGLVGAALLPAEHRMWLAFGWFASLLYCVLVLCLREVFRAAFGGGGPRRRPGAGLTPVCGPPPSRPPL